MNRFRRKATVGAVLAGCALLNLPSAMAAPLPGGTLDPTTIPKYVQPLVIPPVMKDVTGNNTTNDYDIAVRQFQQQILPGAHWNAVSPACQATPGLCNFPATTVWSYGPAADELPDSSLLGGAAGLAPALNSQFNYPAFTVENTTNNPTTVDWINDLVANPWPSDANDGCGADNQAEGACNSIPHILPIDQTLHWANPGADCLSADVRTDCRGQSQIPYAGPVPIVTHVHGAHSVPNSDGYPEAWYLPAPTDGSNFSCVTDPADADPTNNVYVCTGTLANGYGGDPNTFPGVANFSYANDQDTATYWYHDHTLGMTRNNVYAGPAGFWLLRTAEGGGEDGLGAGSILPGPAPKAGDDPNFVPATRAAIREIPIVIQDRSFNADGSLFYPANRAFFEGLGDGQTASTDGNIAAGLDIPFIPGDIRGPSDIAPIWNPEAFFNTMVVNGTTWPVLEVAPAQYRLRLLNGCNSRFLNLAMFEVNPGGQTITSRELPFFQIGAEQSLMPQVVMVQTGFATTLAQGAPIPTDKQNMTAAASKDQALLMGLAERADTLVDFSGLPNGTRIRMINTAPDAPFGGFPDVPADARTTGQVMEFVVNTALNGKSPTDPVLADGTPNPNAATAPNLLALTPVDDVVNYPGNVGVDAIQDLALLEEESAAVCVSVSPNGSITYIDLGGVSFDPLDPANICFAAGGVPFAPMAAVLGTNGSGGGTVQLWSEPITTNPVSDSTEEWELWNWSADAHPIHIHLVKFKVTGRSGVIAGTPSLVPGNGVQPWENGWKDTVIAYPGEVTRVAATFDIDGLYVWHCHIVEHEDNEMMVPFCVGDPDANGCAGL